MDALKLVDDWPVDAAAVVVVERSGDVVARRGPTDRPFYLASVTKLLTAYAVLIAVEEGATTLDAPAGPAGSTVAHLLAHASGLALMERTPVTAVGSRRVYSNAGFEVLGEHVEEVTGIPFADYLDEAVFQPLAMTDSRLKGSPGAGVHAPADELASFAAELMQPSLLPQESLRRATTVTFPGLIGVLPGFGRQEPNDWGLGFEIRDGKSPHWTGRHNSPDTFGHFGQSGTFLWVDPAAGVACICLTDRDFGEWAKQAWPALNDALLSEFAA